MAVKDTAFTYMFGMEEHVVDLYDTITGIRFKPSEIKSVRLEDGLLKGRLYNDVAFLTPDNRLLILIEHQTTLNPNMIFRLLEYYIALVSRYIRLTNQNKYGTKALEIPKAELYVVYNGKGIMEKLPILDLGAVKAEVKVFNIHFDNLPNREDRNSATAGYALFADLIESGLNENEALDEILAQGYLPEFFGRKEHRDMFAELFSYDNELIAKGEAIGEVRGEQKEKVKIATNLLSVLDDETIAAKTGLTLTDVQELRQKYQILR